MGSEDDIARATTPLFPYADGSGFEGAVRVENAATSQGSGKRARCSRTRLLAGASSAARETFDDMLKLSFLESAE